MTPLAQLKAARVLIADEKQWTRFVGARDAMGRGASIHDTRANCFCLTGALSRVAGEGRPYMPAVTRLAIALYPNIVDRCARSVVEDFNDSHTHAEVLALLDRTIALAEVTA